MRHLRYVLAMLATLLAATPAPACTSWLAAGDAVKGGGTLVAKNRDWTAGDVTTLHLVRSSRGLRYFALFAYMVPGNKGGINEAGLTALSLSAPREPAPDGSGQRPPVGQQAAPRTASRPLAFSLDWILSNYRTVDETLQGLREGAWRLSPRFLVLADAQRVAYVEVGPEGKLAVRETDNGTLVHANSYLEPSLASLNAAPREGRAGEWAAYGRKRLDTAQAQMASQRAFTLDDVRHFSQDPVVCYDFNGRRTNAIFAVRQHLGEEPRIWVRLMNPGEAPQEAEFPLSEAMSGKALEYFH